MFAQPSIIRLAASGVDSKLVAPRQEDAACASVGHKTTAPNTPRARARRVRFGPPDRLSPLGEVYLQPTLTAGHGTGEGGSRERGGEKMVWEPDRFNARVAHRLRGRPRFELIKARDLESLATA